MFEEIIDKMTNTFTETIFCKKENELEKQIKALKTLLENYPDTEELKKQLKLCEIGLQGEKEIEYELKNANIGMYVLHDVNFVYNDLKAQIDYIVITPAYTYFIECKNLHGTITVDSQGNFNREYYYGNKKIKEGMYSPLAQAQRHVEIYKKIWSEANPGIIDQLFKKKLLDFWNKSLVVMANSKNILNLKYAPEACKEKVIKSDNLVEYIKKDIQKCKKEFLSNKNYMYTIAKTILQNYNQEINEDYIAKYKEKFKLDENIPKVKENSLDMPKKEINLEVAEISVAKGENPEREKLKERLIEFRKKRYKEKNIPAYYVFNNEELEAILDLMPKTLEELEQSNVLQRIKLISHGKEIIKIINTSLQK